MVLDVVKESGMDILGGGKIEGLFAHRGLSKSNHSGNNMAGVDAILDFLGLIIANLVDFDALYGHSNNPHGYADALQAFDNRLSKIMRNLRPDNVLLITADHGNDLRHLAKIIHVSEFQL
jgi:phosphopentomutase